MTKRKTETPVTPHKRTRASPRLTSKSISSKDKESTNLPPTPLKSARKSKSPVEVDLTRPDHIPPYEKALDMLKYFDINYRYGPCTGLSRLDRYERAERLGLLREEDKIIKDILGFYGEKVKMHIWYDIL